MRFNKKDFIEGLCVSRVGENSRLIVMPDKSVGYDLGKDAEANRFRVSHKHYIRASLYDGGPEVVLYSPTQEFVFSLPVPDPGGRFYPEFKSAGNKMTVRAALYDDLAKYRDLAMNPYDWQKKEGKSKFYPHATASSHHKDQAAFRPANAISGNTENAGHGRWNFRSWGPTDVDMPSFKVDFGRPVKIDKIRLLLRADFPHDGWWESGKIRFSDGATVPIALVKSAAYQEFKFSEKETTFVELIDLKRSPDGAIWCALTDFQAWGSDVLPFESEKISTAGEIKSASGTPARLGGAAFKKGDDVCIRRHFKDAILSFRNTGPACRDEFFLFAMLSQEYPVEASWLQRDLEGKLSEFFLADDAKRAEILKTVLEKLLPKLEDEKTAGLSSEVLASFTHGGLETYADAYEGVCQMLRSQFISKMTKNFADKIVYVENYSYQPSFYAYTEGLSDARAEAGFAPDSALCMLTINGKGVFREVLLEDKTGVIRDPDVSYDGTRVLYSHKKSAFDDDYHVYEMDLATRKIRQLTSGKCADIEPKYMGNGDIVFNSTRCEHTVDCYWTEVSNLYMMNGDGRFLRRVGFDQVHTTSPSLLADGRIVYTRWDYNDKGQMFPQGLFLMNPDGTYQTELYGNKSWYPTSILHARQIPGTMKYMATFSGHHTPQKGKLGLVDPSLGRQENSGTTLLAPRFKEEPIRVDVYGQEGPQFAYPFPFSEDLFLVSHTPLNAKKWENYAVPFGLYLMDDSGWRELLASHDYLDSSQGVAVMKRDIPQPKASRVDYTKDTAECFIRNIYFGEGVRGVAKGEIEKVRVIKIAFRRAGVGYVNSFNDEEGVRVAALCSTPIGLGNAAWDTKEILGEAPVSEDGSVYFEIPARTPVYFQPIDKNGNAVSTMRSWTSMQPNEFYSCLGCHGDRDTEKPDGLNIAKGRKPLKLKPFYNVEGGFSFRKHIQPILNANCIGCHNDRGVPRIKGEDGKGMLSVSQFGEVEDEGMRAFIEKNRGIATRAFSLLDVPLKHALAKREFNDAYYNLLQPSMHKGVPMYADFKNKLLNWPGAQSVPTMLPPYFRGSAKSEIMAMLRGGHGETKLTREELDKFAAWIDLYFPFSGDYYESGTWSDADKKFYAYYAKKAEDFEKEDFENIKEYIESLKK